MCGIAGIISYRKNFSIKNWLYQSSKILAHRGNDDDGIVLLEDDTFHCSKTDHSLSENHSLKYLHQKNFSDINDERCYAGIMHRRLSIIDLSEYGHQPMCDESGKVWITYNGEIYNYIEIREELKKIGYKFFSNSDTEVILKAYLHYGKDFVKILNGMWALCIADLNNNQFVLSRDRTGVKPLYYLHQKDVFAFASEQKVFLKTGLIPFEINYNALSKYFIDNVLEDKDEGLFKNILELQPGENLFVSLKNLEIRKEKYFHLDELKSNFILTDENEIIHTTHTLVENSIHNHLRSDVEVAVALSGGIDSSIIAISSKSRLNQLHTFSIVYPDNKSIDESFYIQQVNKQIQANAHLITPTANNFFNDLDELLYSQDIPIWSTSTYNQFLLMKEVHKAGIKVILSGQGSDELFAGYTHHYLSYWYSLFKKMKFSAAFEHIEKSKFVVTNPYLSAIKGLIKNIYNHKKHTAEKFLSKDIIQSYTDNQVHYVGGDLNAELLKDLSYRRLKAFLKCEDRCSMWFGVESRLPFSDDVHLLKYAFQIPDALKLKNGVSKYVLREAFKEELPNAIYGRKDKKGFDAPLKEWLMLKKHEISDEISRHRELLNPETINKYKGKNEWNDAESNIIFKLYVISRWMNIWK